MTEFVLHLTVAAWQTAATIDGARLFLRGNAYLEDQAIGPDALARHLASMQSADTLTPALRSLNGFLPGSGKKSTASSRGGPRPVDTAVLRSD